MTHSQNEQNHVIILGSGTSTGIPIIGCECAVCNSKDEKNKRLRTSTFLTTKKGTKILVDTSTDFRTQALKFGIKDVDFALITHEHADHLHGIDDLRPLCFGPPAKEIPVYTHREAKEDITKRFSYIFDRGDLPVLGGGIPRLTLHEVTENIHGEDFTFYLLPHGHSKSLGFYHDGLAYLIDCQSIPTSVIEDLKTKEIELLIIDCVKKGEHNTHLTVEKAFQYIQKLKPKRAGLIHMGHDLDHDELYRLCKQTFDFDVFPTFDGQNLFY